MVLIRCLCLKAQTTKRQGNKPCRYSIISNLNFHINGTAMNEMLAKKSAKYVKKHYPKAVVKCFKGKAHCENSIFNPEYMITELDNCFYY